MSDIDENLRAALSAEDEAFLKQVEDEDGLFKQMGATFSGPLGGWTVYAFIMSFVLFLVAIWSVFQMLGAESVRETVLWLPLFSFASLGVGLIKIWFWMRMNHLAVMRELKRIELRMLRDA